VDGVYSASFSPDGRRIVTASLDKTLRLWDAATGKPIGEPLRGHQEAVYVASFSPDGGRIVSASQDRTARLWDAATGMPIGEPFKGHQARVFGASFSPDGQRIVTASEDNTAMLWDAASGKLIRKPISHHNRTYVIQEGHGVNQTAENNPGRVFDATFSPDGQRVVTASQDTSAFVWKIFAKTQDVVDRAKRVAPRCLTLEKRKQFFLPPDPPAWCTEMGKWPYQHSRQ
jgi:WD40 repeat protein